MSRVRQATMADLDEVFTLVRDFATSFRPDSETFAGPFRHLIIVAGDCRFKDSPRSRKEHEDRLIAARSACMLLRVLCGFVVGFLFA